MISKLINIPLNPGGISFLYEVALQDLALSPKDDEGMTDKILRDETRQPNTQTWNKEIYLHTKLILLDSLLRGEFKNKCDSSNISVQRRLANKLDKI
jgi:hypothetical protein